MNRNHIVFFLSVSFALLLFAGCKGNSVNEAAEVADSFMNSYYKNDYERAKSFSTDKVIPELEVTASIVEGLDSLVKEEFFRMSEEVKVIRREATMVANDTVKVLYDLILPEETEVLSNTITVTRISEDEEWKVDEII